MEAKDLLEKYQAIWHQIEMGNSPIPQSSVIELEEAREQISDELMGMFYFRHACYDSAYELLKKSRTKKADALIRICKKRLGINQTEREDLPKLDLEKIRPGITQQLSKGAKHYLGEGRLGWFKNQRWEITTFAHQPIIWDLIEVNLFQNGMAKVILFNGESATINRYGTILKIK